MDPPEAAVMPAARAGAKAGARAAPQARDDSGPPSDLAMQLKRERLQLEAEGPFTSTQDLASEFTVLSNFGHVDSGEMHSDPVDPDGAHADEVTVAQRAPVVRDIDAWHRLHRRFEVPVGGDYETSQRAMANKIWTKLNPMRPLLWLIGELGVKIENELVPKAVHRQMTFSGAYLCRKRDVTSLIGSAVCVILLVLPVIIVQTEVAVEEATDSYAIPVVDIRVSVHAQAKIAQMRAMKRKEKEEEEEESKCEKLIERNQLSKWRDISGFMEYKKAKATKYNMMKAATRTGAIVGKVSSELHNE